MGSQVTTTTISTTIHCCMQCISPCMQHLTSDNHNNESESNLDFWSILDQICSSIFVFRWIVLYVEWVK